MNNLIMISGRLIGYLILINQVFTMTNFGGNHIILKGGGTCYGGVGNDNVYSRHIPFRHVSQFFLKSGWWGGVLSYLSESFFPVIFIICGTKRKRGVTIWKLQLITITQLCNINAMENVLRFLPYCLQKVHFVKCCHIVNFFCKKGQSLIRQVSVCLLFIVF